MKEVVIVSAARTALGSFMGTLGTTPAHLLGAAAMAEAVRRAGIDPSAVDEAIVGNVLQAGQGQAPARQATLAAGLPPTCGAVTLHKVCGSGLKSVMQAAQAIMCEDADVIVAGGMENMSLAPYLLLKGRTGYRMGDDKLRDHMVLDGLWCPVNDWHMGMAAEKLCEEKGIGREEQDAFAAESYRRALKAIDEGKFKEEIVPVEIPQRKGDPVKFDTDEEPGRGNIEKLPKLRPAFKKDGTVTAGNASSINDGAAAVVLMSAEKAKELGCKPMARIVSQAAHGEAPEWFTVAPAPAMEKALEKAGLEAGDIDLWEINEAFSCVSIYNTKRLDLDPAKVNVNGGAVSIGHPIGASGARILVTLLYAMKDRGVKRGCASLCIGGGEAVAMIVEAL